MTELVVVNGSLSNEECSNSQALQVALELSMLNINSNLAVVEGSYYSDPDDVNCKSLNVTQCVTVPSSEHVAEIVGKQGCKIKALRAKTNTYIKTPVRGEEPVFSISGRPDHVNTAKWEIMAAAEHFSQIRASRPQANATGPGTDKVTIFVRVPYRVVGLVVGPRGSTVKRIQQLTRTFIVTPSRDKEPCFEVRGTPENVERARKEIESYIVFRTGNKPNFDEEACDRLYTGSSNVELGLPMPTVFSGMRFTPPDTSYHPMPAPLLTSESACSGGIGNKQQPLSPTGSYESTSSDGAGVNSPKPSPLVQKRVPLPCCMCRSAEEDMAALIPCGHNIFCQTCAHYIACSTGSCPLCNTQVINVMHI